jgi:ComF family protein
MAFLTRLQALALHWLLPQTCAHCREDLPPDWTPPLCASCRGGLEPAGPPFCQRCAEPLAPGKSLCRSCAGRPFSCRLLRAAYLYRGPAASLVLGFKYRGRRAAARDAGRWMAGHWRRFPELSGYDTLVPVPLHPRRLRERGYNQAELLAEGLSSGIGLPVMDLLERGRDTRPQWDLAKEERRRNLLGAFRAKRQARGLSLLLVDDVCTTGASLEECGRALHRAGARRVAAFVFSRQVQKS